MTSTHDYPFISMMKRIAELIGRLDHSADATGQRAARELVHVPLELHGVALRTVVDSMHDDGAHLDRWHAMSSSRACSCCMTSIHGRSIDASCPGPVVPPAPTAKEV